jgi:hypothetical protein
MAAPVLSDPEEAAVTPNFRRDLPPAGIPLHKRIRHSAVLDSKMTERSSSEHRDRGMPRVAAGAVGRFLAYMETVQAMLLH